VNRRRALALLAVAGLAAAAVAVPSALGHAQAKYTVTGTDFKFKIAPLKVAPGKHTFTFVNRGHATHDFKIAGKKTRILDPGGRQALTVTLKKGRYPYLCTVPGHAALGMKGVLVVK
jgi:plastocyanin